MTERTRYVVQCVGSLPGDTNPAYWDRLKGWYAKLGGHYSPDLSEANVVGWSRSGGRWATPRYRMVPVRIVPE